MRSIFIIWGLRPLALRAAFLWDNDYQSAAPFFQPGRGFLGNLFLRSRPKLTTHIVSTPRYNRPLHPIMIGNLIPVFAPNPASTPAYNTSLRPIILLLHMLIYHCNRSYTRPNTSVKYQSYRPIFSTPPAQI